MGSSKKHKEKDRGGGEEERRRGERGERRPRGHRSRSRSRDRDRDRERDRTRSRRERRERGERGERGEDASAGGPPPEKRVRRDHDEGDEGVPAPKSASGNNSLSIEETNKLRAKLGLKPLETSDAAKQKEGSSKDNPVLFHPENLASIKKKAVLKEKLAALKEKRLINQKLGKVRTLAEEEDWLDDAAVWVQRSRKLQQEKDMAQKRAKVLEEMDAEFGISSLVEEEMGAKKE
uniref:Uncharacterized protein n=1 Tax=Petromyzon marinus TaxID=7757 RepID=S4R575_PETMA